MSTSPLDCLVSLRFRDRDGTESWVAAIAETHNGRVIVRRIGSDVVLCNVSRPLMRILLARGDIVRGARKVWRYTSEELGTVAATLLATVSEDERIRKAPFVLGALAAIGEVNVTAWAESFGMDRADVEDLVLTAADLGALLVRMRADIPRATSLLAGMRPNLGGPASDRKVRAALSAVADLRVRLAAQAHYPTGQVAAPSRLVTAQVA